MQPEDRWWREASIEFALSVPFRQLIVSTTNYRGNKDPGLELTPAAGDECGEDSTPIAWAGSERPSISAGNYRRRLAPSAVDPGGVLALASEQAKASRAGHLAQRAPRLADAEGLAIRVAPKEQKCGTFVMLAETKKRGKKREKQKKTGAEGAGAAPEAPERRRRRRRRKRKKVGTLLRPSNSVRVVPKHHHHEWSCAEKMPKIGLFGPEK